MDTFSTEDEQLRALKKWWDENGVSTLVTVVVAVALIFGWRGWQSQQQAKKDAGAFAYQELVQALSDAEAKGDDISIAQAAHLADKIKSDYSGSGYSYFAAFFQAQQAVADKDFATAESELRWVLEQNPQSSIADLAQLRLARVLFTAGRADEALELLTEPQTESFAPLYAELRGDILIFQKKYQLALEAYQQSQQLAKSFEMAEPFVLSSKIQYVQSYL